MSHFHSNMLLGSAGNQGYEIARSLRFNDDDTASLSKTFAGDGNLTTWTWSGWVKRSGGLGVIQNLFGWINLSGGNFQHVLGFDANNQVYFVQYNSILGGYLHRQETEAVYRDVSAWYHVVAVYDTDNTTAGDRARLYVNGERITSFSNNTNPSSGREGYINDATYEHGIGNAGGGSVSNYFDGYMAEVNFVDGQALDYTSFGETDSDTGAWIPKKYIGTYGTNGFYLNFSDNSSVSALGTDSSGNGNTWTVSTNFSVSAGADNDSLEDTPTNNHATFNAIDHQEGSSTFSEGNLKVVTTSSGTGRAISTIRPTSGKWYCEFTADDATRFSVGVENGDRESSAQGGASTNSVIVFYNRSAYFNGSATSNYLDANISNGNTIQVALDLDNNAVYVGRNNTWGNSATASEIASGTTTNSLSAFVGSTNMLTGDVGVFVEDNSGSGTMGATANFGQRAFTYTPPTGFKALNTANLPVPTIKNGTEYMQTVLYTGNAAVRDITVADNQGATWQPDWVWIKGRPTTSVHSLFDSVRGATKFLRSHDTTNETTDADTLTSFNSDGFSLGADVKVNTNGDNYVSWNWKETVDAGFDIVADTGTGAAKTVSHNLGVAPKVIIRKSRTSSTGHWYVYHYEAGASKAGILQLGNGFATQTAWNSTEPTSSVFSVGSNVDENKLNDNFINYLFAEVENYSKFGSYEGNGSSDGTFIALPFKPSFFLLKNMDRSNTRWIIMDNVRDPYNVAYHVLAPSSGVGEDTSETYWLADFVSNGVKLRYGLSTENEFNRTGDTYIYMAFAETPFKYANAR